MKPHIAIKIYSKQLGLWLGANERDKGAYTQYMTDGERVCNNAENSSAKSIAVSHFIHRKLPVLGLLFCFLLSSMSLAQVTMKVDNTKMSLNDTLTLTLISDNPKIPGHPNISVLEKDFTILSTEHRLNYNFINGVAQSSNEWVYLLFPKHTGIIRIPPLSVGQEAAPTPLTIEITTAQTQSQPQNNQNVAIDTPDDVFIKTNAATSAVYVNAQILYTVKIFNRRHLLDVEYTPPEAPNSLILPLDQTKHYQTTVGNNIYTVEELQYAIFPNQSGTLTIQPPQLKALMYDLIPEHIKIQGQTLQVTVKPAPAHLASFLPARNLSITEQFDPQNIQLNQGDTLTRTITLSAAGLPASLLPPLNFSGKEYAAYPSPPQLKNNQSEQGIIGESTIRVTYLFDKAGPITLPALEIKWFNTKTRQPETTQLPARNLTIIPNKTIAHSVSSHPPSSPTSATAISPVSIWMISTLLLALILFFMLIKRFVSFPHKQVEGISKNENLPSLQQTKSLLKQACMRQDAKTAARQLLHWANLTWPNQSFLHLKQVEEYCDDEALAVEIDRLIQTLYRQAETHHWEGKRLWKAFETYIKIAKSARRRTKKQALPGLNPE
jgi:hypothetical protein